MRYLASFVSVFVLAGMLAAAAPAGVGDLRDCGPDRLLRGLDRLPDRAEAERRCTRVIAHGSLGPFRIGDSKSDVLTRLAEAGVAAVELRPVEAGSLRADDGQLASVFAAASGLAIFADGDPDPLRVELSGDEVARAWGGSSRLDVLRARIVPGRSREQLFAALLEHGGRRRLTVRAYVPGGEAMALPPTPAAVQRILAASRWRFEALAPLCPFSPFHSRVDLVFAAGRLRRIEHFCFPYELPQ